MKIIQAAAGFAIAAAAAFAPAMLLTAPVASAEPCLGALPDGSVSSNSGNQACMDCMYANPTANICFPAPFVGGPAEGDVGKALGVG
jgi:hypothetical protein